MREAKPVFLKGKSEAVNIQAGFRKDFIMGENDGKILLDITARSFYRVYLNGEFIFHGPARAGFGHARVDTLDLTRRAVRGANRLAVEVAGYGNAYGYSNNITCESSFLLAEITADHRVVCSTDHTWKAIELIQRRREADRYSHCREVSELYDLNGGYFSWRDCPEGETGGEDAEELTTRVKLLPRGMEYPDESIYNEYRLVEAGGLKSDGEKNIPLNFYEKRMEEKIKGLSERPSTECCKETETPLSGEVRRTFGENGRSGYRTDLADNSLNGAYFIFDFGKMSVGFKGIDISLDGDGTVDIIHAERIEENGGISARPTSNNALRLHCKKGRTRFVSFEPYAFRYLKVAVRGTKGFVVHDAFVRNYQHPDLQKGSFLCSDEDLNRIYESARLTLKLNTLDIFMDCPDRERGGWLCDSFWTGRASKLMLGDTLVEKAMLENFLHLPLEEQFNGFFPSCYPAMSQFSKGCITTWSFWLVLELAEYYERSADRKLIDAYKQRIEALFNGVKGYLNRRGLIENMPGIFIDWSVSNKKEYTQPISVPANALYAKCLEAAGQLYGRGDWIGDAGAIRDKLKMSAASDAKRPLFSDSFEIDENGVLKTKGYYSESGLYTSLWADIADAPEMRETCDAVIEQYGPCPEIMRKTNDAGSANMFIGLCIRLDLLSKTGRYDQMLKEIEALYLPMLKEGPGTLWESRGGSDSRCHGFNSHAGVLLSRDILGLGIVNELAKQINISPNPCRLHWAKGCMDTNSGMVSLSWFRTKELFRLILTKPEGYTANIQIPEELWGWRGMTVNGKTGCEPAKAVICQGGTAEITVSRY